MGEGPSLTDVLVILYLLFTECSNSKGTKISKEGGSFLGAAGVGVGKRC